LSDRSRATGLGIAQTSRNTRLRPGTEPAPTLVRRAMFRAAWYPWLPPLRPMSRMQVLDRSLVRASPCLSVDQHHDHHASGRQHRPTTRNRINRGWVAQKVSLIVWLASYCAEQSCPLNTVLGRDNPLSSSSIATGCRATAGSTWGHESASGNISGSYSAAGGITLSATLNAAFA
jgi:hypothetical protein